MPAIAVVLRFLLLLLLLLLLRRLEREYEGEALLLVRPELRPWHQPLRLGLLPRVDLLHLVEGRRAAQRPRGRAGLGEPQGKWWARRARAAAPWRGSRRSSSASRSGAARSALQKRRRRAPQRKGRPSSHAPRAWPATRRSCASPCSAPPTPGTRSRARRTRSSSSSGTRWALSLSPMGGARSSRAPAQGTGLGVEEGRGLALG